MNSVGNDSRSKVLRRLHLLTGLSALVAFLATGAYMDQKLDHLREMAAAERLYIRTCHLYIMWSALPNLLIVMGLRLASQSVMRKLQFAASLALVLAPGLLTYSFFFEPINAELSHPVARYGIYLSLGGTLAHGLLAWLGTRARARASAGTVDADSSGMKS